MSGGVIPALGSGVPYCGPVLAPEAVWWAWNTDPVLITGLILGLGLSVARLRGDTPRQRALGVAWVGLVVAFVSPLCAATVALFAARAVHHLVLVCLVAPALALALPWRRVGRRVGGGIPLILTALVLVLWHVPFAYAAAWDSTVVYWGMQASLLASAWAFWSAVMRRKVQAEVVAMDALMIAGLAGIMGLIGAVLTFAPSGLYPQHLPGSDGFGLTLLQDQQLAGLIMWVPGFLPLAALAFAIGARAFSHGHAT